MLDEPEYVVPLGRRMEHLEKVPLFHDKHLRWLLHFEAKRRLHNVAFNGVEQVLDLRARLDVDHPADAPLLADAVTGDRVPDGEDLRVLVEPRLEYLVRRLRLTQEIR